MPRPIGIVQIEGKPELSRDMHNHAVLCTDPSKLKLAKEKKKLFKEQKAREQERLNTMESDIAGLKGSMGRIEGMLQELLGRKV